MGARWGGSHCPHPPKDPFLEGQTLHGTAAQVGERVRVSLGVRGVADLDARGGLLESWVSRQDPKDEGHGQRGNSAKAQAQRAQAFGEPEFPRNWWFCHASCRRRRQLPHVRNTLAVVFQSADTSVPLWGWDILTGTTEAGWWASSG